MEATVPYLSLLTNLLNKLYITKYVLKETRRNERGPAPDAVSRSLLLYISVYMGDKRVFYDSARF